MSGHPARLERGNDLPGGRKASTAEASAGGAMIGMDRSQMLAIINKLLEQTSKGVVEWRVRDNIVYVSLRNLTLIEVYPTSDTTMLVRANANLTDQVGQLVLRASEEGYPAARALYDEARKWIARDMYSSIMDAISRCGSEPAMAEAGLSTPGPQAAASISSTMRSGSNVETEFFKRIAGRWHLDDGKGQELVTIDRDGNCFIGGTTEQAYGLSLIAANAELTKIEWAKDRPNGKRLQIEVLDIEPNVMKGYTKDGQHRLIYTRLK